MSIELTFNGEHSADLVERLQLEEIDPLFRFEHHYKEFLRRAENAAVKEACVHYSVSKLGENAGMVTIRGVSLDPRDIYEGRAFDGIGPGAVEHAKQRHGEIRKLLSYKGELYTVVVSPVSDEVVADSRR